MPLISIALLLAALMLLVSLSASGASDAGGSGGNPPASGLDQKVQALAFAIGSAEGFGVNGSVPQRAHNPGDLGPGDCGAQYEVIHAPGSDVCILPDDNTGWQLLYNKLRRIFAGHSHTFSLDDTIGVFAAKYVSGGTFNDNSINWANNVAASLGITTDVTLRDYLTGG